MTQAIHTGAAQRVWRALCWAAVISAFGLLGPLPNAQAVERAVLVGVSGTALKPLKGPPNDVAALYAVLRSRGLEDGNITVVADNLAAPALQAKAILPTHSNILTAFHQLVTASAAGDQVIIYLSGHGLQQPEPGNKDGKGSEPDGLDEVFVPLDARLERNEAGMFENALIDDEIGRLIDAMRERGAFVWLIVDACHSATADRGGTGPGQDDDEVVVRTIPSDLVGEPFAMQAAFASAGDFADISREKKLGGFAAFFAALSHQEAIETRMPRHAPRENRVQSGLLTFTLVDALAKNVQASLRDLAQMVIAGYDAFRVNGPAITQVPSPSFEGDLDRTAIGARDARTAWSVIASAPGEVTVAAGGIHGLTVGSKLALRGAGGVLTYGIVIEAGPVQALVRLEQPLTATGLLMAEPVTPVLALSVTVKVLPGDASAGPDAALAGEALALLSAQQSLRMLEVRQVADGGPADIYLRAAKGRLWFQTSATGFNPVGGPFGHGRTHSIALEGSLVELADRVEGQLTTFVRARNLLAITNDLSGTAAARDLDAALFLLEAAHGAARPGEIPYRPCVLPPADPIPQNAVPLGALLVPELRHCDTVYMRLHNRGDRPIDITVLHIDADYGIYVPDRPPVRGTVRLEPNAAATVPYTLSVWNQRSATPLSTGAERLIVIGVRREARERTEIVANFAWLRQISMESSTRAAAALDTSGSESSIALGEIFGQALAGRPASRAPATSDVLMTGNAFIRSFPFVMAAEPR